MGLTGFSSPGRFFANNGDRGHSSQLFFGIQSTPDPSTAKMMFRKRQTQSQSWSLSALVIYAYAFSTLVMIMAIALATQIIAWPLNDDLHAFSILP